MTEPCRRERVPGPGKPVWVWVPTRWPSPLSERNHEIIRLRHKEGLTLVEIGKRYGISKQRVCQIAGSSILALPQAAL